MHRGVDPLTTKRIKSLEHKLHDGLLTYGYLRSEVKREMGVIVPKHLCVRCPSEG